MKQGRADFKDGFEVLFGNERSQAATMTLAPGAAVGGPDNRHRGSDQWLYVAAGEGEATVAGDGYRLSPGSLLLIERGDSHEIRNPSDRPLCTLNVYVPPAYARDGEPVPRGEA